MSMCLVDEATLARASKFALHNAVEAGDLPLIASLLTPVHEGEPPLHDIDGRDNMGCTPLHVAVLARQPEAFRACISANARLTLKCNGSPLLHLLLSLAAHAHSAPFVRDALQQLLALNKLDTAGVDDMGRTPLHLTAAAAGLEFGAELAAALIAAAAAMGAARGAPPLAPGAAPPALALADKSGATPLHAAASARNESLVRFLLSRGASPMAREKAYGDTPAHAAARAGWAEGVALLLAVGESSGGVMDSGSSTGSAMAPLNTQGLTPLQCLAPRLVPPNAPPMLLLTHDACSAHHTCEPLTRDVAAYPPENTARLAVLLKEGVGTLTADEFTAGPAPSVTLCRSAPAATLADVLRVHEYEYVRRILSKCGECTVSAGGGGALPRLMRTRHCLGHLGRRRCGRRDQCAPR